MNIQSEIEASINHFIRYFENYDHAGQNPMKFTPEMISGFMLENMKRRSLNLNRDTFESVIKFLEPNDMLAFCRINKQYNSFINCIWGNIMLLRFPSSFIPLGDNKYIRLQLSLVYYYNKLSDLYFSNEINWKLLKDNEQLIKKSINEMKTPEDKNKIETLMKTSLKFLNNLPDRVITYLNEFKWNSMNDLYTVKQELDMRLKGYNMNIKYERIGAEIHLKWLTGEYNENWSTIHPNDVNYTKREDGYEYREIGLLNRRRKRPAWCY